MRVRPLVWAMVQLSKEKPDFAKFSLLFLFAYAFLLRLPSEALPVRAGRGDYALSREGTRCTVGRCGHGHMSALCRCILSPSAEAPQKQARRKQAGARVLVQ